MTQGISWENAGKKITNMGLTWPNAEGAGWGIQLAFRSAVPVARWSRTISNRKDQYVRKYLYLAMATASAAVLAAPIVADAAPAAHSHVLTIRKVHGTAVKSGAKLQASLAKGTSAVFQLTGSLSLTIKCKSSSFTAKVLKNPTAPGKAAEAITAESIGKCTINFMGATVKATKALNLPYNSTVSDKKKLPVTVSGSSKKKPIELTATASTSSGSITCTYMAATIAGNASNKGNTITIAKQKLKVAPGSNGLCPANATFSAKYGPVKDISVKGKPAVFVN